VAVVVADRQAETPSLMAAVEVLEVTVLVVACP